MHKHENGAEERPEPLLESRGNDIFWGDFSITCVEEGGLWKVQREVIVGTAFLRFQGGAVG